MNKTTVVQQAKTSSFLPPAQGLLQRKCACGNHTVAGDECAECAKNKGGLKRKLTIGASNDPLEQEADQVADQVLTVPVNSAATKAPLKIQRFTRQAAGQADTSAASVDQVLVSPGRPLEPSLREYMEQRFGHDFSRVRVHSGGNAEQSAREVNAHAYTVGQNMIFGKGRFAPETNEGRWLIAHELTHVVQQTADTALPIQREPDAQSDNSREEKIGETEETGDLIDDYETGADNEVAPEEDSSTNTDEEESFSEEPEQLQGSAKSTTGKWILVKLPRTLIRFEGSKQISSWGISGGKFGHPTPRGSFRIGRRDENHTSSSYGTCNGKKIGPLKGISGKERCRQKGGTYVGADMHFFQEFAPQVGFHRGDPSVLSHGCIHVNARDAETLWKWSATGIPVVVCSGSECAPYLGKNLKKKKNTNLQTKLAIGASDDPLEQEADRIADQVMTAPVHSTVSGTPPRIQRYAGQAIEEAEDTMPTSVDRVLASSGRPLELSLRQDMEQRFGHDFSQVRLHFGGDAEQSARELNANAYTVGHNVVFGAGQFAPESMAGKRLLAHELTHVVQQASSPALFNFSPEKMNSGANAEQEAEESAEHILADFHNEWGASLKRSTKQSSRLFLQRQELQHASESSVTPGVIQPIDFPLESAEFLPSESIFIENPKLMRLAQAFKELLSNSTARIKITGYISVDAQLDSAKEKEERASMQNRFNTLRDTLQALGIPKRNVVVERPDPSSKMGGRVFAKLYKEPRTASAPLQMEASSDKIQTNRSVTIFPDESNFSRDLKLTRIARAFRSLFNDPEANIRLSGSLKPQGNISKETEDGNSMRRRINTVRDILVELQVPMGAISDGALSLSNTRGGQLSVDVYATGSAQQSSPNVSVPTQEDEAVQLKVSAVPIDVQFEKHGQSFTQEISAELTLEAKAIAKGKSGPFDVSFGIGEANTALGLVGERKPGEKLNIKGKTEAEFAFTLVDIDLTKKIVPFPEGTKFSIILSFSSDFLDRKPTPIEPKAEGELEVPLSKKNTLDVKLEATPGLGVGVAIGVTFEVFH
jgi:hypothetical protein